MNPEPIQEKQSEFQTPAFKAAVGIVIAALLFAAGFAFRVSRTMNTPVAHEKAEVYIEIPRGSAPKEIFNRLDKEGVLPGTLAVTVYFRLFGDPSKLKAGEYRFESPITPKQVLADLEKGQERTIKLTIPEGFTRFDIAKRIAANFPVDPPMDEAAVLALMDDTSLIADIDPLARNIEGYTYPTTYNFPVGSTPQQVVRRMVEQFRKEWKPEWTAKAAAMGKSVHEIVTIASMIETESKFDAERVLVASVIYNRLRMRMALGIDQTAVYIAKMEGRWDGTIHKSDLESTSPYNTRKFAGLPPGPISSVSVSAIEAALNPATTDYIFYVLNVDKNDGSHNFYASAAEFERGKRKYQEWLATQR